MSPGSGQRAVHPQRLDDYSVVNASGSTLIGANFSSGGAPPSATLACHQCFASSAVHEPDVFAAFEQARESRRHSAGRSAGFLARHDHDCAIQAGWNGKIASLDGATGSFCRWANIMAVAVFSSKTSLPVVSQ